LVLPLAFIEQKYSDRNVAGSACGLPQCPMPRDENAVYQKGKRIGEVVGVRIDASSKSLVFDRLTLGANLDQTSNIEYRNLVLAFAGMGAFSQARQGRTLLNAQFSILGNQTN
jgi:hypothetical protein